MRVEAAQAPSNNSASKPRAVSLFTVTGCLSVLLACGGGGGSSAAGPQAPPPPPAPPPGDFSLIGTAEVADPTDLWLHGEVAYVGSRTGSSRRPASRSPVQAFDVRDPAAPRITANIEVDAAKTNDVKVSKDGGLLVVTHEGSSDGRNGITLFELTDPRRPSAITRFTDGLSFGVHNVWIDGNRIYAVTEEEAPAGGIRIIDASDPAAPELLASYYGGSSFTHDVHVVDGLAFVAHWDLGLVILDVGAGVAGGSPEDPVAIGRHRVFGAIHSALYWPETGYVFLTEEQPPGRLYVVDARDLRNPTHVASAQLPGGWAHNVALDETRQVLYVAWSERGLVALDVSGELAGDLVAGGRMLGETRTLLFSFGVQVHEELIYVTAGRGGSGQLQVYEPLF